MIFDVPNDTWQAVSAIVAALALLINSIMAVSIFISVRSLRETVATKESAILFWAVERIADVRPTMNAIRDCKRNKEWLRQHHDDVMRVLDTLQIIAFMALEGVIDKRRIASMWGKSFVEQWRSLAEYVGDFRESIGEPRIRTEGAFFARSFEEFASYCQRHLVDTYKIDVGDRVSTDV